MVEESKRIVTISATYISSLLRLPTPAAPFHLSLLAAGFALVIGSTRPRHLFLNSGSSLSGKLARSSSNLNKRIQPTPINKVAHVLQFETAQEAQGPKRDEGEAKKERNKATRQIVTNAIWDDGQ